MSSAEVKAHNRKHGFEGPLERPESPVAASIPKPRMNGVETRYSLILEAMKRRGEIIEWRFEGVKLAWGCDPETGKAMYYTPDFWIRRRPTFEDSERLYIAMPITLVECKGPHIYEKDVIRFKGCRSDWPMFHFELHQYKAGSWARIL